MFESLYQSFEDQADPSQGAARIAALRAELARLGLDGFLVPRADQHQNEYVAACEERLAWLSGFTGSAGLAIVLKTAPRSSSMAAITWRSRIKSIVAIFKLEALTEDASPWLGSKPIFARARGLAMIPGCIRRGRSSALARPCKPRGQSLLPSSQTRSTRSGRTGRRRRSANQLASAQIRRRGCEKETCPRGGGSCGNDALLMSDPHAVAWVFNIRGHDVAHTPLPLAYALILKDAKPRLYVDARKLDNACAR